MSQCRHEGANYYFPLLIHPFSICSAGYNFHNKILLVEKITDFQKVLIFGKMKIL